MSVAPLVRRPLGCLKTSLRQARQKRTTIRNMATETTASNSTSAPALEHGFFRLTDRKTKTLRSAFAVYPSTAKPAAPAGAPKTLLPPPKNPLEALHAAQIKKMDPTGVRTALFSKSNREGAKVGDILLVTHRRGGEPFAGVLLSIRRRGIDSAILLRNHLSKVGVEMWYKIYNKNVAGIEIVKRKPKRARRARLTYMRKPKHDMGSVDEIVNAWRRNRRVFTTGKPRKGGKRPAAAAAAGKK